MKFECLFEHRVIFSNFVNFLIFLFTNERTIVTNIFLVRQKIQIVVS